MKEFAQASFWLLGNGFSVKGYDPVREMHTFKHPDGRTAEIPNQAKDYTPVIKGKS